MSNHPPRWLPDRARAVYEDTAARIAHYTPELDGPALLAYSVARAHADTLRERLEGGVLGPGLRGLLGELVEADELLCAELADVLALREGE